MIFEPNVVGEESELLRFEEDGGFDVVGVEVGLGFDAVAWHLQLLGEKMGGVC